jgi:hypothetical protein
MRGTGKPRKKPGPPKTGVGYAVGVRLQPDMLARLDGWIANQPEFHVKKTEVPRWP